MNTNIEYHHNDNLYLFPYDKYQTNLYNITKAKTKAQLMSNHISLETAELYSNYYTEYKVNKCSYNKNIMEKFELYGLVEN